MTELQQRYEAETGQSIRRPPMERKLNEQWIEVIEGERHLVMEVKSDKEHAACPRCMFNGGHGTCVYPEDDCPVRNGHYIKDLGILNDDGCVEEVSEVSSAE